MPEPTEPTEQADNGPDRSAGAGALLERICELVREHCPVEVETIDAATHLITDLGYDSMRVADLLVTLQIEFGLEPPDDYAAVYAIGTVGDLAAAVESAPGPAA